MDEDHNGGKGVEEELQYSGSGRHGTPALSIRIESLPGYGNGSYLALRC